MKNFLILVGIIFIVVVLCQLFKTPDDECEMLTVAGVMKLGQVCTKKL